MVDTFSLGFRDIIVESMKGEKTDQSLLHTSHRAVNILEITVVA